MSKLHSHHLNNSINYQQISQLAHKKMAIFLGNRTLIGLGLGQFLSFVNTMASVASSEASRRGIDSATALTLSNYLLLSATYGGVLLYRRKPLETKWYYYLLLGVVDVEANYLVVKSYQYTSLTSVMLIDCWTIPSAIFLTWLFLKTKYGLKKFLGVAICVSGIAFVILSDVHANDRTGGISPIKGDILVIAAATLYAISNVMEEFLLENGSRVELMGMLGVFGAIFSGCQIIIFERNELNSIQWTTGAIIPFLGYAAAMFLYYSILPIMLKISGSTMLNLSLLTSDMFAVLIRVFAYKEKVDTMYYIAFATVGLGLLIYSGDTNDEEKNREFVIIDYAEQKLADEEHVCQGSITSINGKGPYYCIIDEDR